MEVDIHLHEPGMLGAFAINLIAERTASLALQGRITISHVFCLGMVDQRYLGQLMICCLKMTLPSCPLNRALCSAHQATQRGRRAPLTGTDGVRDTWGPYNGVDMLERVKLLGYRSRLQRWRHRDVVADGNGGWRWRDERC